MSVSDPVADMLTKVRNAVMARHEKVDIPASKLKLEIVKILKTEGFIKNFKKVNQEGLNCIRVFLKYDEKNTPVIHGSKRFQHLDAVYILVTRTCPVFLTGMVLSSFQLLWALPLVKRLSRNKLAAS